MKRRDLERHLRNHDCAFHHHGAKHDFWYNTVTDIVVPVPRHTDIPLGTVRAICRELDIPMPQKR